MKSRKRISLRRIVEYLLLFIVVIWSVFPIYYIVMSSFNVPRDIFRYPPSLLPKSFTFQNYIDVFQRWKVFPMTLLNSLLITGGTTIITVAVSLLAGYACSRFNTRFIKGTSLFIIAIRMFPPIIISTPLYPLFNRIGLADSQMVVVMLYTAFEVTVMTWIFKAFFDSVPKEIDEAAAIDGCTAFQTFSRVLLPIIVPSLVTVSILVSIYAWNEFTFAFLFTSSSSKTTPILISEMLGSLTGIAWGQVFAASVMQMLPMVIFLLLVQEFLLEGMKAGAVKG